MTGEVRLWQRAEVTLDGTTHVMGSLRSPTALNATNTEIINKTVNVGLSAVKVWDIADLPASSAATFIWVENEAAAGGNFVWVQITVSQADGDDFLVYKLSPGQRLVFMNGIAQKNGTIDALDGAADAIEEIWALADTGAIDLKVVVVG
jgi:hypothetical protein